jgi:hypothetical protein
VSKKREIHLPSGQTLTGWTVEETEIDEDFYIDEELIEDIKQRLIENIEEIKNNQDAEQE